MRRISPWTLFTNNLFCFLFLLGGGFPAFAQLQVYPTHLTLTPENSATYLNLKNNGGEAKTFEISLVRFEMQPDGSMLKNEMVPREVGEVLKFSPKKVTLAAGEKQVVRVMATTFDGLAEGESYVHLHFVPEVSSSPSPDEKAKVKNNQFALQARVAVAVPVIFRKGKGIIEAQLEDLTVSENENHDWILRFLLKKKGAFFLFGDLEILAVVETAKDSEANLGPPEELSIAHIVGLGSYLPERYVEQRIRKEDWEKKSEGRRISQIKVRYHSNDESAAAFDLSREYAVAAIRPEKKITRPLRQEKTKIPKKNLKIK